METPLIRLVLVEDHALVREGLASIIGAEPDLKVVATYATGEDALKNIDKDDPDLVLLDVRLPGLDGVATLAQIRTRRPTQRVLMVSSQEGDEAVFRSLKGGAVGYVLKKQPSAELIAAIRQGAVGKAMLSPDIAVVLTRRLTSADLTAREIEILKRIAQGEGNHEIGTSLGISHNTVKNHIVGIMSKLGASDRTHAVTLALQRGLIDLT